MREKMVFFDIDGTLLTKDKEIQRSAKEALYRLQEKDIEVGIATGRAPFMFHNLRRELGIQTFVSFNGQYVVYKNEVVFSKSLHKQSLEELEKMSEKIGHPIVYMDQNEMVSNIEYHESIEDCLASLKFDHPPFNQQFFREKDIYQALLFCEKEEEQPFISSLDKFDFVRWHKLSTDVLPAGGSKAIGIKKLINILKIDQKDVYAFGDGLNDLEMLTFVGTGIAMGNATDEVKLAADYVTASVDDDGIYHGLKHFGLL